MMRTYGKIWFDARKESWKLSCEPFIRARVKSVLSKVKADGIDLEVSETQDVCADLKWILSRYPMQISGTDRERLLSVVKSYEDDLLLLDQIVEGSYEGRNYEMAFPPREYQKTPAEVLRIKGGLLLADDLGVGKTVSAILAMTFKEMQPAVVICPPGLRRQWWEELHKFAPQLYAHVVTKSSYYVLPKRKGRHPDVLIISYMMLEGWTQHIKKTASLVVFEECHELRLTDSNKYKCCKLIADAVPFRLGLSGTPVQNYGGEIFNIVECLRPGVFGDRAEFNREWCESVTSGKVIVTEPRKLSGWLKSEHIMMRRTKSDVDRELPELISITHVVDSNMRELNKVSGKAGELARIILGQTGATAAEQGNAVQQFSQVMRQATGLAKAPAVAAFVEMLIESGHKVVLFGWHRAVYQVWRTMLDKYKPSWYTGTESDKQKMIEKQRFIKGETPLLIMSTRSGVGVDGLQNVADVGVNGELDWNPALLDQNVGRLHRDGQKKKVTFYYLVSNHGLDPKMIDVLGLKRDQVRGIRDDVEVIQRKIDTGEIIRQMAQEFLNKQKASHAI